MFYLNVLNCPGWEFQCTYKTERKISNNSKKQKCRFNNYIQFLQSNNADLLPESSIMLYIPKLKETEL